MNPSSAVRFAFVTGLCLLLVGAAGGIALAQERPPTAQGSPDISVYVPEPEVSPGTATELTIQLDNQGQLDRGKEADRSFVTTARSVVVELDSDDAPIVVKSGARSIGTLTEDEPREVPFRIEVPDDAEPGTYDIDVDIEYDYTDRVQMLPGIVNDQSQSSRSVTETVEIDIDDSGRFRVTDVESSLRVGEEGEITGNLTNIGGEDVTNAEVRFATENPNIVVLDSQIAVGDIDAGDSAPFRLPVEATSEAEAVTKRFDLPVTFRDENGIRAEDPDPEFLVNILEKRDEFLVSSVSRNVTAGTSQQFDLEVTNNREQTVTDVEAKLFTNSPLDSSDDEAFIESLEPGESTTVTFDLSASAGATAKTYPITADFRYDDERGRSQLSDNYRIAIDVTESEDDGIPGWVFGVGLVVVGAVGYVWYRRQ